MANNQLIWSTKFSTILIVLLVVCPTAQTQPVPPVTLETLVFSNKDSLESIRANFASRLAFKLNAIDRACQLTPDQKRLLELAGKGDIKRFFDQFFALKEEISAKGLLPEARQFRVQVEILGIKASSGLHHDHSVLGRSIRSMLTPGQLLRYDTMTARDHHRMTEEAISRLDQLLGGAGDWPGEQRAGFQELLRTKLKPVRNSGPHGFYCLVIQLGRIDRSEYENLLPANQRNMVLQFIEIIRPYEAGLREAGYVEPDESPEPKPIATVEKGRK